MTERSESESAQDWRGELYEQWARMLGLDPKSASGEQLIGPLFELVAAGWEAFSGTEQQSAAEPAARLREALDAWRDRLQEGVSGLDPMLELARQLMGTRHFLAPVFAGVQQSQAGPWPRLGPLQNEQAALEELQQSAQRYANALMGYGDRLAAIGEGAIRTLSERLNGGVADKSPRKLFDLWAACAEEHYEAELESDAYGEALGELANAWAEFSEKWQRILDGSLDSLGLPTRGALASTQEHLDAVRRRQRRESRELRSELEALRREVQALKAGPDDEDSRP